MIRHGAVVPPAGLRHTRQIIMARDKKNIIFISAGELFCFFLTLEKLNFCFNQKISYKNVRTILRPWSHTLRVIINESICLNLCDNAEIPCEVPAYLYLSAQDLCFSLLQFTSPIQNTHIKQTSPPSSANYHNSATIYLQTSANGCKSCSSRDTLLLLSVAVPGVKSIHV